jgi:DDE domain
VGIAACSSTHRSRTPHDGGTQNAVGQVVARRFFTPALAHGSAPAEVTTDKAGPYIRVLDELLPAAAHVTEQYGNNRVEAASDASRSSTAKNTSDNAESSVPQRRPDGRPFRRALSAPMGRRPGHHRR